MSSKTLIIYEFNILFEVLDEIKDNLNCKLIKLDKDKIKSQNFNQFENYIIISQIKVNFENCHQLKLPSKINKIIEQINILFLGNKFSSQSKIKIGNYELDLNSRKILKNEKKLNLTERETDLLLYLQAHKLVNLNDLQREVWKHTSDLDSHTVETHIYRLRKKFEDIFDDKNFIKHNKKGYFLN